MKVVTAAEMKSLDQQATSEFKIPSQLLMENAGRGLVDQIEQKIGPVAGLKIAILCGSGNNGGDGLVAARHLRLRGAEAIVYLLVDSPSSEEMAQTLASSDLIIDALLGTGLSRPVDSHYRKIIETINAVREESDIPVISVDIPSGISADTGEILGVAVHADYTFTMGLPKRGLFLGEGLEHRGQWDIVDIGFPNELIDRAEIKVHLIGPADIAFSPRRLGSHKGDFGHLLIIAGSRGKVGAAAMTALSALRSGAGLVTVALPESIDSIASTVMEAMTLPLSETKEGTLSLTSEKTILNAMEGKEALVIGPGLSQQEETIRLVLNLIGQTQLPIVIDADGINALASDLSVLKRPNRGAIILTPHPGEMGRLLGISAQAVQKDRIEIATRFASEWNVILVLKGAHTVIAAPDRSVFLSNTGNPGMATAGTGDVLAGMIGALLAQGILPISAACWGVVLHGLAGDIAVKTIGEVSLMATDLIAKIPEAMMKVRR